MKLVNKIQTKKIREDFRRWLLPAIFFTRCWRLVLFAFIIGFLNKLHHIEFQKLTQKSNIDTSKLIFFVRRRFRCI
jgi:hypothetical protein